MARKMSSRIDPGSFRIIERQHGEFLRLEAQSTHAKDVAAELLGLFEAEFDAEPEDTGGRRDDGMKIGSPVLIRLETLEIELSTDGNDIVVNRVAGSQEEFDELCTYIREYGGIS